MVIQVAPLLSFVLITTFTPGPNNISSASMGILHGYRGSVTYLTGIASGFFLVMLLCAFLSHVLLGVILELENILRWFGAGYIFWLAWGVAQSDVTLSAEKGTSHSFFKGFVLQLVNPKAAVYGMTLYSTFLAPIAENYDYLTLSAACFSCITFTAVSTWALFGSTIRNHLHNDTLRKAVNHTLALLLVWTGVSLL